MICIGIIGEDRTIYRHINTIKNIPEFNLKGYYYPERISVNNLLRDNSLKRFSALHDFLDSIDAIDIIGTGPDLYDIVISALKRSKHIYMSPLLLKSYEQASKIIKLAIEANITLMVQKSAKYNAALIPLIKRISGARLIDIQHHARFKPNHSNCNIFNSIINSLDIIHAIVRSDCKLIKACGINILNSTPDIVNARVEFDNGCVANINCSNISITNNHKATFILKNEIIKVDFRSSKIQVLLPEKDVSKSNSGCNLRTESSKITANNPLYYELISFRDSIINNSKSIANVEDGFKSLLTAFKIFEKVS
jgi:predicted dehydrogenase